MYFKNYFFILSFILNKSKWIYTSALNAKYLLSQLEKPSTYLIKI